MEFKNIIIITSEFPPLPGGIGNHALNLAKALHAQGCQVRVLCDFRAQETEQERAFDRSLAFQVIRVPRYQLVWRTYWQRMVEALRLFRSKEDTTVIASGKFSLWLGAFGRLFFPKHRYIGIVHGSEVALGDHLSRWLTHRSLGLFHQLIAVSGFTRQLLQEANKSWPITVINNGFTPAVIEEGWREERLQGCPALITVGNVTYRKGQQNVIKALPTIKEVCPEVHYHVVGIPTEKEAFSKLAEKLGVAEHVTFHGMVSDSVRNRLVAGADIFMMLSDHLVNGDVEGFGIAILEANHLGLPAIGSRHSGVADAIEDGASGILVDPYQTKAISEAVERIMGKYDVWSAGAEKWSERFLWEEIITQYQEVIRKAI